MWQCLISVVINVMSVQYFWVQFNVSTCTFLLTLDVEGLRAL